jgi:hypothetical protein
MRVRAVGRMYLVDSWADAAEGEDLLQLPDREIADANVLHQPLRPVH